MKKQRILMAVLCCCLLVLCAAVGWLFQDRGEIQEQLSQLREEKEQLELQLTQAKEEKTEAEEERDETQRQYESMTRRDNPIDKYEYASNREWGGTTYEMSTNAAFFRNAWELELTHLVGRIKEERKKYLDTDEDMFVSDRVDEDWLADYYKELDRYQRAVEEQSDAIVNMISLEWSAGYRGTAASVSMPSVAHSIYRAGTLKLLNSFAEPQEWQKVYSYAFDDDTVTQLREELGDPLAERIPGRQMFPSFSQVFPDSP